MSDREIQSFRDLDAWKVAMDLTVVAYNAAKLLPKTERYELSSQVRRAAVSIPSNIAEGKTPAQMAATFTTCASRSVRSAS